MSMAMLAAAAISSDPAVSDEFVWAYGKGGKFNVRDAYCSSRGHVEVRGWEGWCLL